MKTIKKVGPLPGSIEKPIILASNFHLQIWNIRCTRKKQPFIWRITKNSKHKGI